MMQRLTNYPEKETSRQE